MQTWKNGLIFLIKKLSDKETPKNYITLTNCLGKLFNKILYNRLEHNIENKNIISSWIPKEL